MRHLLLLSQVSQEEGYNHPHFIDGKQGLGRRRLNRRSGQQQTIELDSGSRGSQPQSSIVNHQAPLSPLYLTGLATRGSGGSHNYCHSHSRISLKKTRPSSIFFVSVLAGPVSTLYSKLFPNFDNSKDYELYLVRRLL